MSTLNALCGGIRQVASPEEILLMREQIDKVYEYMKELDPREEQILVNRLGLFGASEMTWLELGDRFGVSKERIRQIFWRAIRSLARKYRIGTRDRQPIARAVSEYPDLCELLYGEKRESDVKKSGTDRGFEEQEPVLKTMESIPIIA